MVIWRGVADGDRVPVESEEEPERARAGGLFEWVPQTGTGCRWRTRRSVDSLDTDP